VVTFRTTGHGGPGALIHAAIPALPCAGVTRTHHRRPRRAAAAGFLAVAASAAVLVAGQGLLPDLNPFGTVTRDRSQPALLRSLERLSEYRAARANLQQVVDIEKDARLLPSFVKGERTVMVAAGDVDAIVDFRRIGPRSVQVSDDRREVVITLPAARLADARLDLARTRVIDHDRGLIDRTGDLLGEGGADDERQLLLLAQRKLDSAATADRELLPTAERNTAEMLRRLAGGLGFERVTVRFQRPPAV
jgi:hypothetical protein